MVTVFAVGEFVGDDGVDDPFGPVSDFVTDADVPVCGAAVGAGAEAGVHVADPADGDPVEFIVEAGFIDAFRALLQICVGAAFAFFAGEFLFSVLQGEVSEEGFVFALGVFCGYTEEEAAIGLGLPADGFCEAFVGADGDGNGGVVGAGDGVVGHGGIVTWGFLFLFFAADLHRFSQIFLF